MATLSLLRVSDKTGAALIGVGLAVVLIAQMLGGVPVAAAMALIGWGASLTLLKGTRTRTLTLVNLVVYVLLVSFTIASQSHAAGNSTAGELGLPALTDHVFAAVLLISLVWYALHRTFSAH